jgi:hypothetical protein
MTYEARSQRVKTRLLTGNGAERRRAAQRSDVLDRAQLVGIDRAQRGAVLDRYDLDRAAGPTLDAHS